MAWSTAFRARYSVIIDGISHEIPFYRAFLKRAVLHGAANPPWCAADDKFISCAQARKLGVAIPLKILAYRR